MRRLWRVILNGLTAVSLALFLATLTLWARSYHHPDWGHDGHGQMAFPVISSMGRIAVYSKILEQIDTCGMHVHCGVPLDMEERATSFQEFRGVAGIGVLHQAGSSVYGVLLPHWLIALLFGVVSAVGIGRRRRGRIEADHCPTCGYDLRATPEKCPECGTMAQKVTA